MNNITKKTMTITLLTTMLIALSMPIFANTVSASSLPNWDVTGTYLTDITQDPSSFIYKEQLILVQDGSEITGSLALYPSGDSLWIIDDGFVSGDDIEFGAYFSANPTMRLVFIGTIDSEGFIGGTWADVSPNTRTGTLQTTEGNAQPAIISLTFPPDSTAVASVEIIEEVNLPPCIPMLPEGIGQYIQVEIIDGSFDGTVIVCIRYDDTLMTIEEEQNLRLYMGDCVDFNGDGTINGKDLALIKKAIKSGVELPSIFNVDNDDDVDEDDVNIVKEYMSNGLIVNPGLNDIDQARLPWLDITLSVDTTANIICGETDHFSIFRGR